MGRELKSTLNKKSSALPHLLGILSSASLLALGDLHHLSLLLFLPPHTSTNKEATVAKFLYSQTWYAMREKNITKGSG